MSSIYESPLLDVPTNGKTNVSDIGLEEYVQHVDSLCAAGDSCVKALNKLEKEQFKVIKLKQVQARADQTSMSELE